MGDRANCRVALVSMHTSPVDTPGRGDAGGMNVYLEAISRHLVTQGCTVELLTRRTEKDQPDAVPLASGATLRHLDAGPPDTLPKVRLAQVVQQFTANVIALPRYDVVHSHYWLSGVAGLAIARAGGAPHVLNLHTVAALKNATLAPGDEPEPEFRVNWEADLVRSSALTIAATHAEARAITSGYDADPDRIAVIPPGVDRELFHPDPPASDRVAPRWCHEIEPPALRAVLQRGGYLMMAARTQPLKGHDVAIEALAALDPAVRRPLVLVGDASPGHQAFRIDLAARISRLGLDGQVWFLPAQPRDRTADLLRGAALLLAPSRSETFGLVTLEAAASGTPTVASRVNGLAEAVGDNVSGVLVDGFAAPVWAAVIGSLLSDAGRLRALGASARRYSERFDWEHVAAELAGHYRRLAAGHGVTSGPPPFRSERPA